MPTSNSLNVPVNVVGSSTFGIRPKTSIEKTFNMFISDDWLLNYAGFKKRSEIGSGAEGRGLFVSIRGGFMIAVVGTGVYKISDNLGATFITNISSSTGQVSMAENLAQQICIVDGINAYIYNYKTDQFQEQALTHNSIPVKPFYVDFHNGYFLLGTNPNSVTPAFTAGQFWYAAIYDTDTTIRIELQDQFRISTKPDNALAVRRMPGKGNNVIVFGSSVAEFWTQVGGSENYRRIASSNINVGCLSVSTIAASDDLVVWLASNENEAPIIMVTDGQTSRAISSDGIDHLLESLNNPKQSTGFIYKQNGHLFYHLTFYDPRDNLSLLYDFNTDKFFHISDENQDFYPARVAAFFNKKVYFVSLEDNGLYEMSQDLLTYNYDLTDTIGEEIPRIRITKTIRKEDSARFRANQFSFWLEQGVNPNDAGNFTTTTFGRLITEGGADLIVSEDDIPLFTEQGLSFQNELRSRVDLTISKDGNQAFSRTVSREMNAQGKHRNQINWHRLGQANELTFQLRFWGFQRFVAKDAVCEVY